MEFIPLKKHKKSKNTEGIKEKKHEEFKRKSKIDEELSEKGRKRSQTEIEKKVFKSTHKEPVSNHKFLERTVKKKKRKVEEEEDAERKYKNYESDVDHGESEANKDTDEEDEKDEEAFRRKCKEMDEKKKNRLFVKLKKKILHEMEIKELHPDIRSVIFPRKRKNSRWCWAVFASQEKAAKAMKDLIKNKDVIVGKPTPYEKVERKRKEKMKTLLRKKQAKKKLQKLWM